MTEPVFVKLNRAMYDTRDNWIRYKEGKYKTWVGGNELYSEVNVRYTTIGNTYTFQAFLFRDTFNGKPVILRLDTGWDTSIALPLFKCMFGQGAIFPGTPQMVQALSALSTDVRLEIAGYFRHIKGIRICPRCAAVSIGAGGPDGCRVICTMCKIKELRNERKDVLRSRLVGTFFNRKPAHPTMDINSPRLGDVCASKQSFLKTDKDGKFTPVFGVELECEGKRSSDQVYDYVAAHTPDCMIVKYDGSLRSGYGAEIVTVPATLRAHKEIIWEAFYKGAPHKTLRGWHAKGAGIHIHISKDIISPLEHGKMLEFINSPKNADFIALIAGRQAGGYCMRTKATIKDGGTWAPNHYDMLSTSRHTGSTYELRIFRSNIAKRGLFKNLEFAAALIEYVKLYASCSDLTYQSFLKFIQLPNNSKEFRNLIDFLKLKGWLKNATNKEIKLEDYDDSKLS